MCEADNHQKERFAARFVHRMLAEFRFVVRLVGVPPFASTDEEKLYDLIKKLDIKAAMGQDAKWATKSPEGTSFTRMRNISQKYRARRVLFFSFAVKDLIAKMLNKDTAHRFTSHEVLDHPWITVRLLHLIKYRTQLSMCYSICRVFRDSLLRQCDRRTCWT